MDGEDDHVHLLVEYPPRVPVSGLVNSLKGSPAASWDGTAGASPSATGRACCGARATSPRPAAAPRSPSSASTSNSSSDRTESGERGIEPRSPGRYPSPPERRGLSRFPVSLEPKL